MEWNFIAILILLIWRDNREWLQVLSYLIGLLALFGLMYFKYLGVSCYYGYYVVGLKADWLINLLTTKELLISNIRLGAGDLNKTGPAFIKTITDGIKVKLIW